MTRPSLVVVVGLLVSVGCAVLRPTPLDVPPGHRAVLGRLDVRGLGVSEGTLDVAKEDGSFEEAIHASFDRSDFAVSLPPGRYRVTRLRAFQDSRIYPNQTIWDLKLVFEVGPEPAVYIGTLRFGPRVGQSTRVQVLDEYEYTLRVLRARYPDLPGAVTRSLLRPE